MKKVELLIKDDKIFSHVRQKWLIMTPEEEVRQKYLINLIDNYGYELEQIAEEESVTGRGSAQARADFLIWRSIEDRTKDKPAFIVVECKADYITISEVDYQQGENYARREGAEIFVTHNSKETKVFKILKDKRPGHLREIEDLPKNGIEEKDLEKLYSNLKAFKENEFANVLHKCHNIIRNREKLDPAAAFDEIAKILFMKVYAERDLAGAQKNYNIFSLEWVEKAEQFTKNFLEKTFEDTKKEFATDKIFAKDEKINLRVSTIKSIIRELQSYNLSKTSEDIKGIAFERFLGKTFRGEIGQFFTPRPIVKFMVDMLNPKFGDVICDPASGSGGFLIRVFEKVKAEIEEDIREQYQSFVETIYESALTKDEMEYFNKSENSSDDNPKLSKIIEKQKKAISANLKDLKDIKSELEKDLQPDNKNGKIWQLSNRCIYGTDANERMARTSKMNMIMHGDGHGGIHHHDGFLNVNGIFEERFDIILTNPPFGSSVERDDTIREPDINDPSLYEYYKNIYKDAYIESQNRIKENLGKPITYLFDLTSIEKKTDGRIITRNSIKTELLFIERCLSLLKSGGRLGIVLPEGVFNNPSLAFVREFAEDRAYISAVISLPMESFVSTGASVKTSLLFMRKFSNEEKNRWDELLVNEKRKIAESQKEERKKIEEILNQKISKKDFSTEEYKQKINDLKKEKKQARTKLKGLDTIIEIEGRNNAKEQFNYKIFMCESEHCGITSTGEIDEESSDLSFICTEYLTFLSNPEEYKSI